MIGEHVLVNGDSGVGHDAVVGSYSSLLGSVSVVLRNVREGATMFGSPARRIDVERPTTR